MPANGRWDLIRRLKVKISAYLNTLKVLLLKMSCAITANSPNDDL